MTAGGSREHLVERRLRQALEARAESVTVRDLRPSAPPRAARRRLWRRRSPTSWVRLAGLAGLAAALACVAYLTLAPEPAGPRPVLPAVPSGTTSPPTPTPSTVPSGSAPNTPPQPRPSVSLPEDPSPLSSTAPTPQGT
ncbi:UNVERIFIED_CONTAM: hypothetical protein RKD43_006114 [Streptomyces graminofaciens]